MPQATKTLERPDGKERVVIYQRADGGYTYARQWLDDTIGDWGEQGPECGIFDSAVTAETEACQRVDWLRKAFH